MGVGRKSSDGGGGGSTYYCSPAALLDTKLSFGPNEKKDVVLAVLLLICSSRLTLRLDGRRSVMTSYVVRSHSNKAAENVSNEPLLLHSFLPSL